MNENNKLLTDEKYLFPINTSNIPKDFLNKFKIKNPKFKVDEFEELILQDVMRFDENTRVKLNRDVTPIFSKWLKNKIEKKENIGVSIKGQTRSGKSLISLKFTSNIIREYDKPFDTEYIVCGNQKEYRLKLSKAKFGDVFQIDENAFSNVGEGSMTEAHQLKDIGNIIAKQNIHTFYITPRVFLNNNAELGLSYWGKDVNNWCSRFLLYSLKNQNPILMGYVIIDVGALFKDYGCFFYKLLGGCTNPNRLRLKQLNNKTKSLVFFNELNLRRITESVQDYNYFEYSSCLGKDKLRFCDGNLELQSLNLNEKDVINNICPFYRVCHHPLNSYELKKDNWINKEMSGGMDERSLERFRVAVELIKKIGSYDLESNRFMLKAKNKGDLKIKMALYLPKISNTKFTETEKETIINTIQSLGDIEVFKLTCENLKVEWEEQLKHIENGELLINQNSND